MTSAALQPDALTAWGETEGARDADQYPGLKTIHRRQALRFDELAPDGPVLDLGCGRNPISEHLDRSCNGIDVDRRLATEACSKVGTDSLALADGTRLPYHDDSLAGVFMRGVIHHLTVDRVIDTLREIERVVQPGGICEIIEPDTDQWYRKVVWAIAHRLGYNGEQTSAVHLSPAFIRELAEEIGLELRDREHRGSHLAPLEYVIQHRSVGRALAQIDAVLPSVWWADLVFEVGGESA